MKYNSRCLWISLTFIISAILSCGSTDDEPERPFESSIDTVVVSVSDTLGLLVGDSSLVFGTITQASWGKDGRLYVLDGQFGRLAIYSEELEFFRYIGRLGSGPGEFQYPQSFAFLSDGRFIHVISTFLLVELFPLSWSGFLFLFSATAFCSMGPFSDCSLFSRRRCFLLVNALAQ